MRMSPKRNETHIFLAIRVFANSFKFYIILSMANLIREARIEPSLKLTLGQQ